MYNENHLANYKGCRMYKELQKNMFLALRKKTVISLAPLVSKVQSEPKQTNYLYQTVKVLLKQ